MIYVLKNTNRSVRICFRFSFIINGYVLLKSMDVCTNIPSAHHLYTCSEMARDCQLLLAGNYKSANSFYCITLGLRTSCWYTFDFSIPFLNCLFVLSDVPFCCYTEMFVMRFVMRLMQRCARHWKKRWQSGVLE